ncbi:putative mediator of RNA polymerase II transcription subunit 26 [Corticium candelabrum]|uniref:putative mediator of RNA polymerase II transcription subunit 26 n=1 Tax=Corticium candelabrum TaxID=121492 RepID=UPI002E256E3F|nr:putative mediator of RNA polymerase II transcription subunit 26 [Corticium candelabrum]
MSTLHSGHHHALCERFTKDRAKYDGHHRIRILRPEAICDYNAHMGGVDKSDQMIKYYEVLHKSLKYWKKIFLHMIDLAILNSFIMFTALQKQHPQDERLQRKGQYAQKDFRCELIRGLAGIDISEPLAQFCFLTKRMIQIPAPTPQQRRRQQEEEQQLQQQIQQLLILSQVQQHRVDTQQQHLIQQQQQQQQMQQEKEQMKQQKEQMKQEKEQMQQQKEQLQQQLTHAQQQIQQQQQQIQQRQQQQQQMQQQMQQQHLLIQQQQQQIQQQQQQLQQVPNSRYSSHMPVIAEGLVRCIVCVSEGRHNSKTRYRCQECNVPLCVSSAERQCFIKYHTEND